MPWCQHQMCRFSIGCEIKATLHVIVCMLAWSSMNSILVIVSIPKQRVNVLSIYHTGSHNSMILELETCACKKQRL